MNLFEHKPRFQEAHPVLYKVCLLLIFAMLLRSFTEFLGFLELSAFLSGPIVEETLKLSIVVSVFSLFPHRVSRNRRNIWLAVLLTGTGFAVYEQLTTYGVQHFLVIATRIISHPLYMVFGLVSTRLADTKSWLRYYLVFSILIHAFQNIILLFVTVPGKYAFLFSTLMVTLVIYLISDGDETSIFNLMPENYEIFK